MITISSFIHRQVLKEIITRWMYAQLDPCDAQRIVALVHFNNVYVSRYLGEFARTLLGGLYPDGLRVESVSTKGQLKDVIVRDPPYSNPRIEQLVADYQRFPEHYYRETPFSGTLFFAQDGQNLRYVGSARRKRVRRLSEKIARYIIDHVFNLIRRHADLMADERAQRIGVSRHQLVTQPDEMLDEFLQAENRMIEDLRLRRPLINMGDLTINDVAGVKVIAEADAEHRVRLLLEALPRCEIIEEERHRGRYNATNIIVRYRPPREELVRAPLGANLLALMSARGLSAENVESEFRRFVASGEETVDLEVIMASYEEMLESEIGRCMHESRIENQRIGQPYNGQLARNLEYLIEYFFCFPFSSKTELRILPIKVWNRYLPDYFEAVIRDLFQIPSAETSD